MCCDTGKEVGRFQPTVLSSIRILTFSVVIQFDTDYGLILFQHILHMLGVYLSCNMKLFQFFGF